MNRQVLTRFFPFLSWPRPDRALLASELWAGTTVGLMLIPQAVAYAALAGMPLVTGIYAAMLPALVAVLWSSSTRLGVGPTALTCLLIGSALTGLAEPASPQWVALAVWLALMTGALQLVLGLARFGWLLNLVSSPVLTGFTQAAAILILLSQVPAMLGSRGGLATLWDHPSIDWTACAFGLASLAALVMGKRWLPRLPTVVLVVIASSGVSAWLGFAQRGGAVVGALPAGFPALYWPPLLSWQQLGSLIVPAMIITLVSFLETASSAKVENQRDGRLWNENQDLIGQGLAKITAGLSGAFPISSSFSRSAINLYAGARTGWATVVSVGLVLLVLLWGTPLLYHVPQSVLAAVVAAAVGGLVKPSALLRLWAISRTEALTGLTTFALTLATAPRLYWGVLAGLLMSMSHYLYTHLHPRIIEVGLHPDGSLRDRHLWHLPPLAPRLYALRMDAELDFASARSLERNIVEHLAAHPEVRHVCLLAQPINRIDVTGAEVFQQLQAGLQAQGITLHISGIKLPVETVLRRSGALPDHPLLKMYRTDAECLQALALISDDGRLPQAAAPAQSKEQSVVQAA